MALNIQIYTYTVHTANFKEPNQPQWSATTVLLQQFFCNFQSHFLHTALLYRNVLTEKRLAFHFADIKKMLAEKS